MQAGTARGGWARPAHHAHPFGAAGVGHCGEVLPEALPGRNAGRPQVGPAGWRMPPAGLPTLKLGLLLCICISVFVLLANRFNTVLV